LVYRWTLGKYWPMKDELSFEGCAQGQLSHFLYLRVVVKSHYPL